MCKQFKFFATLLLCAVACGAWAQTASVNDKLWLEEFTVGTSSTQFSATSNWNNYLNTTMLVSSDASSLSYSSSNAMANNSNANNMNGTHVWLNKNTTGHFTVAGIPLYNASKVKVAWAQAGASKVSVSYAFDGDNSYTELSSNSTASSEFFSNELNVSEHTTISLKFQRTSTNTNVRIDNLSLIVTELKVSAVATPSISGDANFQNSTTVNISTTTNGATIYYTTDGSNPTTLSTEYTAPFTINTTTTVKAIAVKSGMAESDIATATFTKELKDNAINGLNDSYTIDLTKGEEGLTFTATATSGATVLYDVVEEGTTLTSDDYEFEDGYLFVSKKGTIVIRAYVEATSEYKAAEKTVTVIVLGEKEEAMIAVSDQTLAWGGTYTLVEDEDYLTDGEITLTSSNPSVVSVNGLTVTAAAVGTATITATATEGIDYAALATPASFKVTVTSPEGLSNASSTQATTIFYESFKESTGTAGWSGTAASGALKQDNEGWTNNNGYGNGGSAKYGTSSKQGSAISPAIGTAGDFVLTFKSAAWSGDKTEGALVLSIEAGGGTLGQTTFDLTDSQWADYSVTLTGATAATKIKFSAAQANKNRFFLDDVKVETPDLPAPKLTLSASGYASYCCEYPLTFENIDRNTFKAWYVSSVEDGNVTFTEIKGNIKGGEAFFLFGTPGAECQLAYTASDVTLTSNQLNGNELEGTLAPTYIENDDDIQNYGLSGGNFVKLNNGIVPAHKAYLPVLKGELARLNIIFESEEATGINAIKRTTLNNDVYDLTGRKVTNPAKGIYVVNGKKVIFK